MTNVGFAIVVYFFTCGVLLNIALLCGLIK